VFLLRWIGLVIAIFAASCIPFLGIEYANVMALVSAALILAVLNTFLRPLLLIFTLPLVIFSLGMFIWVINALLLMLVGYMIGPDFTVPGFWSAMGGSLIISLVSMLLPSGKKRTSGIRVYRAGPVRRDDDHRPPPGKGPVIDI